MFKRFRRNAGIAAILCMLLVITPTAQAQSHSLDAAAWREDLDYLTNEIKTVHPNPFRGLSADEFDQHVEQLYENIPNLTDKAIISRLTELVSTIDDGHTRLSIPRQHNELSLILGHSGPDADVREAFKFSSLPFRFFLFDDGLHIVSTQRGFEEHLGARVDAIDGTSITDALSAVRPFSYAENQSGEKLMAADRLAIPELLFHSGIASSQDMTSLTLTKDGRTYDLMAHPLPSDTAIELVELSGTTELIAQSHADEIKWFRTISTDDAVFIQFDELDPYSKYLVSDFIADALNEARQSNARRVILDLRTNHGGAAGVNPSIVLALAQSEFNRYGQLYVLVGRETFSAASMLVSELEQYTHAIFVGEPTSARPSSFGDPRKTKLPNSGLTFRVSAIYWQSWLAGDFRDFVGPHLDAPPLMQDIRAGRDGALQAALAYQPADDIALQMAELFDKDKLQAGLLRFVSWINGPLAGSHDALEGLLEHGHRYLDEGALRKGRFMMVMARDYYPASDQARAGLGRALELNDDVERAVRRYREALDLNPENKQARTALMRLVDE